jgi:hypothetical protein
VRTKDATFETSQWRVSGQRLQFKNIERCRMHVPFTKSDDQGSPVEDGTSSDIDYAHAPLRYRQRGTIDDPSRRCCKRTGIINELDLFESAGNTRNVAAARTADDLREPSQSTTAGYRATLAFARTAQGVPRNPRSLLRAISLVRATASAVFDPLCEPKMHRSNSRKGD